MKLFAASMSFFTALALTACGAGDPGDQMMPEVLEVPDGPNGGRNFYKVVSDGHEEPFEMVQLGWRQGETPEMIQLFLTGMVDIDESGIDDEYAINFELEMARADLAGISAPATLTLKGTNSFTPMPQNNTLVRTWTAGETNSPLIKTASVEASCFCIFDRGGVQELDGALSIISVSESAIHGSLELEVVGLITHPFMPSRATIAASFDVNTAMNWRAERN
jgi:hypothetical protein